MTAIDLALPLIRQSEGLKLKAYLCPAGVWTIGYGHTKGVQEGRKITREQAEALLLDDAAEALAVVRKHVRVSLTPHQEAALIDFVFNFGETKFKSSTLLALINQGKLAAVPAQLRRWVNAGGKTLPGLVRRRDAEVALWNTPVEAPRSPVASQEAPPVPAVVPTQERAQGAPEGPWTALLWAFLRALVVHLKGAK